MEFRTTGEITSYLIGYDFSNLENMEDKSLFDIFRYTNIGIPDLIIADSRIDPTIVRFDYATQNIHPGLGPVNLVSHPERNITPNIVVFNNERFQTCSIDKVYEKGKSKTFDYIKLLKLKQKINYASYILICSNYISLVVDTTYDEIKHLSIE